MNFMILKCSLIFIFSVFVHFVFTNQTVCRLQGQRNGTCQPADECDFFKESGLYFAEKDQEIRQRSEQCKSISEKHICCEIKDVNKTENRVNPQSVLQEKMKYFKLNLCGIQISPKISNGNLTTIKEFPWVALLEYNVSYGLDYLCGGSLINENYVLTAAHCVQDNAESKLISVRLGEHNITSDIDCEMTEDDELDCADPVQDIPIAKWIIHPTYSSRKRNGDIALLRLSKPAKINQNNIKPICLPFSEETRRTVSPKFIVTGFGSTENSDSSDVMLKATLPNFGLDNCLAKYKNQRSGIPDKVICAGGESNIDSCPGDSGSPLQFLGKVSDQGGIRMIQYGIVSFGPKGCGKHFEKPGIYTNVSAYMDWILENIEP